MHSDHKDPSRHPDQPARHPAPSEPTPQRQPERHRPDRQNHGGHDRDDGDPGRGQQDEFRKPANRR